MDDNYREDLTQASVAGVLWDESKKWITGLMTNLGQCDSLMVETWAIIHGLEMAQKTGFRKINLEMDSLLLTRLIKEQSTQQRFVPFLYKIKQLLSREQEVTVQHIFREANKSTDFLANMGHNMGLGVHDLWNPSREILSMLQADVVGVSLPCFCNLS